MSKWQVKFENLDITEKNVVSTATKSFVKKEHAEAEAKLWSNAAGVRVSILEVPDDTKDEIVNLE